MRPDPRRARSFALAALAASPLACASKPGESSATTTTTAPLATTSMTAPARKADPIGTATMLPDGTLVLDLTAKAGPTRGHARNTIAPSEPKYAETLRHIGGLRPGEQKPVPPWPDSIDDAAVEATARAYVAEKKGWKPDSVRVEATGTYDNGDVAATVTHEEGGKREYVRLRVDQKARKVVKDFDAP